MVRSGRGVRRVARSRGRVAVSAVVLAVFAGTALLPTSGSVFTSATNATGTWNSNGVTYPPAAPTASFVRAHQTVGNTQVTGSLVFKVDATIPTVAGNTLVAFISSDNYADPSGISNAPIPTGLG